MSFDVDRNKFREWFIQNQELFKQKNYTKIYEQFRFTFGNYQVGYLTEFLVNEAERNPFEYMETIPDFSLCDVDLKSELVIPKSIKGSDNYINNSRFTKLTLFSHSLTIQASTINDLDLMNLDISKLDDSLIRRENVINILRVPKSVRNLKININNNKIDKIVTYPRSKGDRLSIPNSDVDWYKSHLYWLKDSTSESLTEAYDSSIPGELLKWFDQSPRNKIALLRDLKDSFGVEGLALDKLHFIPIDLPLKGNRQRTGPNKVTFIFNDTGGEVILITTLKDGRTSAYGRISYKYSSWDELDNFATSAYVLDLSDASNYMDKQKQANKQSFKDLKRNKHVYKPAESDRRATRNYDASGYDIPTVAEIKDRIRSKYPDKYAEIIANINTKKLDKINEVFTALKDELSDYLLNPIEDIDTKELYSLFELFQTLVYNYRRLFDSPNGINPYALRDFNEKVSQIKDTFGRSSLFDLASIADEIPYLDESDLGI